MDLIQKTSIPLKGAYLRSFRRCLSYVFSLLFVFVSFNPAQAGLGMEQGMMNTNITVKDSVYKSVSDLSAISFSDVLAEASSAGHMMNMTMSEGDHCQSNCDCCPGFCSAYLPTTLTSSTFPPANFVFANHAFQGKVSASTRLFRPPITH